MSFFYLNQTLGSLGFFISLISFIGIIITIFTKLFGVTVSGWSSMIVAVFFMGGVQLLSLGVIGEYVGKTYMETKQRPRFIVSETTWQNDTAPRGEK